MSDDLVKRLRQAVLDKDNFPRMDSERQVACGLAREAAAEIERLRAEVVSLVRANAAYAGENERIEAALKTAREALEAVQSEILLDGQLAEIVDAALAAMEPKT